MNAIFRVAACLSLGAALAAPMTNAQARALFAYPLKGQSLDQENKDRLDCHTWAVQQTGFDPEREPNRRRGWRGARKGAVRGGVGGTIIGAIASGSSGAGAGLAIGAAAGGLIGGVVGSNRQRDFEARYDAYLRAAQTCLEGRGYRVSR